MGAGQCLSNDNAVIPAAAACPSAQPLLYPLPSDTHRLVLAIALHTGY